MKLTWLAVIGVALLAQPGNAGETPALDTEKERTSYGIGVEVARNFQRLGFDLDLEALIGGMRDAYAGGKLVLGDEELRAAKAVYQDELRVRQASAVKRTADENRRAGDAFLAANRFKDGVVALPSGLQYRVLKAGEGRTATDDDTVDCHYRATLLDGTEFDNSYGRGKPATFTLRRGIIDGWREALKLMPAGSKWQLFVPPHLAYGEQGTGRHVGPNATLIYELELLAVR